MNGDQKLTNKRCKKSSTNIEAKSAIFHCVACGESMHITNITKKRTGMSQEAIIGISSIMQNVLLICQKCLELTKKKDQILDVIVSSRTDENIRELKQEGVEIIGEAKSVGNQLKRIKSAIEIKRGIPELVFTNSRDRYEPD